MECLLPYLCMVTVPHIMVGLERMLDYRGVGLKRFHCTCISCRCIGEYDGLLPLCLQVSESSSRLCSQSSHNGYNNEVTGKV